MWGMMTTSAYKLERALQSIAKSRDDLMVAEALAEALELEGADADIIAADQLTRLSRKVQADIEALPFDGEHMRTAQNWYSGFRGLSRYSSLGQTVKQAKSSFLKRESLVNLQSLHMAMLGTIPGKETGADVAELAKQAT